MDALGLTRLMDLERQGWDSLCHSTGGDFYGRLMTPDAVMILVNGMVIDREAIATSLNDSPPWESYELTDERSCRSAPTLPRWCTRPARARRGAGTLRRADDQRLPAQEGEPRLTLYQQTTITR